MSMRPHKRFAWRCTDRRHDEIVYTETETEEPPTCLEPFADWVCSMRLRRAPTKDKP